MKNLIHRKVEGKEFFFLVIMPEVKGIGTYYPPSKEKYDKHSLGIHPFIDPKHKIEMFSVEAKGFISAYKKLNKIAERNDALIVPFPADYDFLRNVSYDVRLSNRLKLQVLNITRRFDSIKIKQLKDELSRKISQNQKWTKKFANLLNNVKEYETNPTKAKFKHIFKEAIKLGINPDFF